jgi:hypothetical protein
MSVSCSFLPCAFNVPHDMFSGDVVPSFIPLDQTTRCFPLFPQEDPPAVMLPLLYGCGDHTEN